MKRLKDSHPLYGRLQAVFDKMDELDVRFDIVHGRVIIVDLKLKAGEMLREVELVDLENADESVTELPPVTEYKLVKDI